MPTRSHLPLDIEVETEPPEPRPVLPGVEAGRLAATIRIHRDPLGFLRHAQRELGDVFVLRLTTTGPQIVVADPMVVKEIAGSDPCTSCAGSARRAMLPMASTRSVFGGDGDTHQQARAHIQAAFTPEATTERIHAVRGVAERHVQRWPRGRPFRLLPRMRLLADEIFTRHVLGVGDETRAREVACAIGRLLWTPGNPPLAIPAPEQGLLGRLVDVAYQRRVRPLTRLLEAELQDQRRNRSQSGSVLGLMLHAEPDASDEQLVDELLALLMAAQEPMAATLTWITLGAASNPPVQERLVHEGIESAFGKAVVDESLRLHPPALAMLRRLQRPMLIADHELPVGTGLMVPLPLIHRDPRVFDDPDAFIPDRRLQHNDRDGLLLPFGYGSRSCIGQHLARTEITTVIPALFEALRLRHLSVGPERMVLRATILVPQRSGLVIARSILPRGVR